MAILLLLESRGKMRASDLAVALETSERTIYRDVDELCAAGVPIVAVPGPQGGFSLMEGYKLEQDKLHAEDVINLYLCGIGVRPEVNSETNISLQNTLLRLEKTLPQEYQQDVQRAKSRFYFDPTVWWKKTEPLKHMDVLRRAVWGQMKLSLTYVSGSKEKQESSIRVVRPYGLVVKNTDWYLVGFCELRLGLRVFRCDRIQEARSAEDKFSVPVDFDLRSFWDEWKKEFEQII